MIEVMWVPPAKLRAFCKLDLRYWPMDKQQCFMKFASWTHHGGQIQLDLYNEKNNVSTMRNFKVSPRQHYSYEKHLCKCLISFSG